MTIPSTPSQGGIAVGNLARAKTLTNTSSSEIDGRGRSGRRAGGHHRGVRRRLRLAADLLAPEASHAALNRRRRQRARQQLFAIEHRVHAAVHRLRVVQRVHADGVAGTRLGAQAAHDAAELVDLEDAGAFSMVPSGASSGTMVMQWAGQTVGHIMQATHRVWPSSRTIRRCRPRCRAG